jgi:hypothetical protein
VTASSLPLSLEVQRRVVQAIGRSTYSWPPSRLLPMLPNTRTEKVVSCLFFSMYLICLCHDVDLLRACFPRLTSTPLVVVVEVHAPHPGQGASPRGGDFYWNKVAAEKRHDVRKAQHKKRQIAKRVRNDNRIKRRKAGVLGVSSDEDPYPEPSWSGDVASAVVDWSDMSGSSSSSPPRGAEVSSSRQPQVATRDKTVGSSSRQVARPARTVHPRVVPSRTCAPRVAETHTLPR